MRLSLGPPDALNVAVQRTFPCLFSRGYAPTRAMMLVSDDDRSGPGLAVRPGASVPAGTLVGPFKVLWARLPQCWRSRHAHHLPPARRRGRGGGSAGRGRGGAVVPLPPRCGGGSLRALRPTRARLPRWWAPGGWRARCPAFWHIPRGTSTRPIAWNPDACLPGRYMIVVPHGGPCLAPRGSSYRSLLLQRPAGLPSRPLRLPRGRPGLRR